MNYEKIVTLYDTAEHAEAARRNLEAAGFGPGEMSLITSKTLASSGTSLREPGLWHRLFGRDIEQHEATVYSRTVEAGGAVLTARVRESEAARAMGILNAHNVVDVRSRAAQQGLISETAQKSAPAPVAAAPATMTAGAQGGEEVLALAEEQLNVGKRLIQQGTTRIRRFVTEKPVEAQVTLHEEHAQVIRRAITDPNFVRNIDWTDKTIAVTETAEEAVIDKTARVVEEVVVRKEGSDQVRTVRDKVRRQQVEVDRVGTGTDALTKSGTEPFTKKG
jgi:uncharacterized protein (TIGR02271 family)